MKKNVTRRDFVKTTAASVVGATAISILSDEDAKAITPLQVPKWDLSADVVILGTGFAGQMTAIIANENGADVLVIEKAPEAHQGGNSRVSGQGMWAPTEPYFDGCFRYLKAMTAGTGYPVPDEYLHFYVEGSSQNKKWFEDHGATMVPDRAPGTWTPFYPEFDGSDAIAAEPSSYSVGGKYTGSGRDWYFLQDIIKTKPGIREIYETPGKRLIQDPITKEVLGVVATQKGNEIYIQAKRAVVIATGGYEYNQQMIRDFIHIQDYGSPGTPYNTGDGIKMGQAAGADLCNMGVYAAPWGMRVRTPSMLSVGGFSMPSAGGCIWIGADSKRYKNENFQMPGGWAGHQPTFCGSVKENGVYRREKTPFPIHAIFDDKGLAQRCPISGGSFGSQIEKVTLNTATEIANGCIVKGDTLADLAQKLGRDPVVLQATVDRWNADCAAGVDSEFGRPKANLLPIQVPPFYAVKLVPGTLNTQGGLLRDVQGHVIDTTGKAIPRLYGAGENGDRVWANLYECMKNVGAGCLATGRVVGKNAAAETPWA